ncbi:spermidine synthase [Micromonospora sp. WMMD987]|uniref:spermine/spermidine synthase domain-containing protein n=1 Tax=Micromonospora TaxID=1873 RepID=UPI00249A44D6|nr:spermidine synthase [Micromonospora sp. WMMD987]WFE96156.1 spermidine synthase [Micromonospora sp. WMMD987]
MSAARITVDRVVTDRGELVLRACDEHYEMISNGVFLMDTRAGESERLLVRLALDAAPAGAKLLIGGLGVGFSLAEAVRSAVPAEVTLVEIEPAVVAWHHGPLRRFSEGALDLPQVRIVTADLVGWLHASDECFDVICLDIDNGPDWTVFDSNLALYTDDGLAVLARRLTPGGVLAVWSAAASPAYARRLAAVIGPVRTHEVDVTRGERDVVYLARRTDADHR